MSLIEVVNVSKSFRGKKVLDNVSVSIERGEIYGLIGASGSGKSVFLRILMGFIKQDSGNVHFNTSSKDPIGFSLQDNSVYENLTVKQNLIYFSKLYGLDKIRRKDTIARLINLFDLETFEKILVRKLSGGTKKRVDIACGLLKDPEIIILDEPLLGLDPRLVENLLRLIVYLNKHGKTIIITSHMIPELSRIATKYAMLRNGKILSIEKSNLMDAYR